MPFPGEQVHGRGDLIELVRGDLEPGVFAVGGDAFVPPQTYRLATNPAELETRWRGITLRPIAGAGLRVLRKGAAWALVTGKVFAADEVYCALSTGRLQSIGDGAVWIPNARFETADQDGVAMVRL